MPFSELNRTAPQDLIEFAGHHIGNILADVPGVEFVMACSADGFKLASADKKSAGNSGKLAAVSSSILAMVQAFMGEISLHGCQSLTLEAENGQAVLTAIPHDEYPMILAVLASKDILLGQLLYCIKKSAEEIRQFNLTVPG